MPFNASKLKAATGSENLEWGAPPPEGMYTVELANGDAFTSRAGEDWAKLRWRVLDGQLNGHEWDAIWPLDDDNPRLGATAKELATVGVDLSAVASLDELVAAIWKRCGRHFIVEVSTNRGFTNTNTQAEDAQPQMTLNDPPIDTAGLPERDAAPQQTPVFANDDDIPF